MAYQTYRPSKKVPIAGLLLFIIGGLLGCFLIEASYVYLMRILGNLFLRVLVIALSLTLHGLWLLWLSRACRIRHPKLVRIISIIILAATLYFGRCVYVNLVQEIWEKGMAEMWSQGVAIGRLAFTWVRLFFRPDKVFAALVRILPYGVASINGVMINSIPLLLLWIVEWALKILIPYYIIAYFISRPYDETKKVWLEKKEEWHVPYVERYREIRADMRKGDPAKLLDAMGDLEAYLVRGQESYAILTFYKHRSHIGPYVSLSNVKAVQSGPRKLDHRTITLCRMLDIGEEEAEKLYHRITESYAKLKAENKKEGKKSDRKISDRLNQAGFEIGRASLNMQTELRAQNHKAPDPYEMSPTEKIDTAAIKQSEEITVHVPRVTPEMEQEYLKRNRSK